MKKKRKTVKQLEKWKKQKTVKQYWKNEKKD